MKSMALIAFTAATTIFSIVLLLFAGLGRRASAGGLDVVGAPPLCTESIAGSFTYQSDTYTAQGTCTWKGSLETQITFPWRGAGSYDGKTAREVITVDPAPISQPSHPYGRWEGIYSCPGDPWLVQFYNPDTGKPT